MRSRNLSWLSFDCCISSNLPYWQSTTSKITSMSLGSQKGWFTDTINAPPNVMEC